jgi:hypothetical protein
MTQKDNAGSIFRNEDRAKDTDRDYGGSAMVDGQEYWVSSWVNESREGKKYLKLSFKPKSVTRR